MLRVESGQRRRAGLLMCLWMACCAFVAGSSSEATVYIPPTKPQPLPELMYINNDYRVKIGDFDGDDYTDLYVTGHATRRAVDDFIVATNPGGTYRLIPTVTDAQRAMAAGIPVTKAMVVSRVDFNADGLFDFDISRVNEALSSDYSDVVILTRRGDGSLPVALVEKDPAFESLVSEINTIFRNIDYFEAVYRSIQCVEIVQWVPYYYGNPFGYGGPDDTYWFGGGYDPYYYGGWTWIPVVVGYQCVPGSALFTPVGQRFMTSLLTATGGVEGNLGNIFDPGWFERVFQSKSGTYVFRTQAVLALPVLAEALAYLSAAIGGAVVITASKDTDNPDVVPPDPDWMTGSISKLRLQAALLRFLITTPPAKMFTEAANDVGPIPKPADATDKYTVQNSCNGRYDTTNQNLPGIGDPKGPAPSSVRLRQNMNAVGCDCPSGENNNAAHHIMPKGDMSSFGSVVRQCLNKWGMHMDSAGNGVCLPTNDNTPTNATNHYEIPTNPGNKYVQFLAEKCSALSNDPAVGRQFLDKVRQHLLNGTKFWEGGPW